MPHPTLAELLQNMENAHNSNQISQLQQIARAVYRRIMIKHNRLSQRQGIYNLQGWAQAIRNGPNQITTYLQDPGFAIIQRRDIDIVAHYLQSHNSIICDQTGRRVDHLRSPNRLILSNPLSSQLPNQIKIESWSRPSCVSFRHNCHLPSSRVAKKSRYLSGIDIKAVEYLVFNNGYGRLASPNQLYIYGVFNLSIGTIAPKNKTTASIVRLQCDRLRRHRGNGYRVEFHGHPISQSQLQKDFSGLNPAFLQKLQVNILRLP